MAVKIFCRDEFEILQGESVWFYLEVTKTEKVGIHIFPEGYITYLHFSGENNNEECDYAFNLISEVGEMWIKPIKKIIREFKIKISKNDTTWDDKWTSLVIDGEEYTPKGEK